MKPGTRWDKSPLFTMLAVMLLATLAFGAITFVTFWMGLPLLLTHYQAPPETMLPFWWSFSWFCACAVALFQTARQLHRQYRKDTAQR